jgi:predicted metal-dependent phosphoesterase TrpH
VTNRLGRADLHIHTRASDGIDPIATILDFVESSTDLDVIAITDHERIDAALAARRMARDLGHRVEIVVGEEVSTLGGHLLALFIEERVRPLRSLRTTIGEIHEQGGLAIAAHPLVPYPLCAQGWVLRRLIHDRDPRVRPDALETFNPTMLGRPWHPRVVRFAEEHGLAAVGNSDAHQALAIGTGWSTFPGRTADDLRQAILERATRQHGSFHGTGRQLATFGDQLRKYRSDAQAAIRATVRRDGTGRDLGYPGGQHRPPRFEEEWLARRSAAPETAGTTAADAEHNRGR